MDERYERFNEITFTLYCMKAIDRAISYGRKEKEKQAQREVSLNELDDTSSAALPDLQNWQGINVPEAIFNVDGMKVPILNPDLANALRVMPKRKRDILLLAYIIGDTDEELSKDLHISKSSAQRQRSSAFRKLKKMMDVRE